MTIDDLITARPTLPALVFESPNEAVRPVLAQLQESRTLPPLCMAALWLWHDFFDESHAIAQDDASVEGSYWHAILHRREPDAFNAKYWFRRVGNHPVLQQLGWNPIEFVDRCERHEPGCVEQQAQEWRALFEWCRR